MLAAGIGLTIVRHLGKRDVHRLALALVQHIELHRRARRDHRDVAGEIARILDFGAVDRGDDVTRLDAGLGRRTAVLRIVDHRTPRLLQAEAVGDVSRHRLYLDAEPAAGDIALVLELGDHELGGAGRNVEADADRTARRRVDRGVDADHVAVHVERRTTGITLVDRRVDLDVIVIGARANVTAARRHDAGGDRAAEAEGI